MGGYTSELLLLASKQSSLRSRNPAPGVKYATDDRSFDPAATPFGTQLETLEVKDYAQAPIAVYSITVDGSGVHARTQIPIETLNIAFPGNDRLCIVSIAPACSPWLMAAPSHPARDDGGNGDATEVTATGVVRQLLWHVGIEYDGNVRSLLIASFGVGLCTTGCGSDPRREIIDAPGSPRDAARDAAPDAAGSTCTTFVSAMSSSPDVLSFTMSGGAFASYGCAPIDPTYWMSGSGMSATVTFVVPQARPSIRVWGMNTDDTAAMMVNGTAYSLDASSASLAPKVVCGLSPGPDGVAFVSGTLIGANTPADGNYSYQDVTVEQPAVTSIQIATLTGAGWGFAGASVAGCATQ